MPPTMGAAMRFITSEPAPVAHMIGNSPMQVVAKVMNLGRRRLTAPSVMAACRSSSDRMRPRRQASS